MTIVVKVGSQSLLRADVSTAGQTEGQGGRNLDRTFMADLVAQVAVLKQQGHIVYLISSGAVGTGRGLWQNHPKLSETATRQILAGIGQVELMQTYRELAVEQGLHAVQILLTKNDFIRRNHYLNVERLLLSMQDHPELLPVINENDSVSIDELMFTDNDQLAGVLAQQLDADLLLLLTDASGVFDKDPRESGARLLPLLGGRPWPRLEGKNNSGRGGISSKLETARKMSNAGLFSSISAARQPQIILDTVSFVQQFMAVRNNAVRLQQWRIEWSDRPELGTLILPDSPQKNKKNLRGVRKWLSATNLSASPSRIIVNKELAKKLHSSKQAISILPIGIIDYKGEFTKGDLIDIYSIDREKIGIGLARYSHTQLSKAMMKQNQAIFIHCNYLHIEKWDS
ncbi:MAG: glutamate 5-kinase, partial [Spirochaetota bacterium]